MRGIDAPKSADSRLWEQIKGVRLGSLAIFAQTLSINLFVMTRCFWILDGDIATLQLRHHGFSMRKKEFRHKI
jgi:hypothetical protein